MSTDRWTTPGRGNSLTELCVKFYNHIDSVSFQVYIYVTKANLLTLLAVQIYFSVNAVQCWCLKLKVVVIKNKPNSSNLKVVCLV